MSFRKIATLAGVVLFGSFGDVSLARGMKSMPPVAIDNLGALISALANPWVICGILLAAGLFQHLPQRAFVCRPDFRPARHLHWLREHGFAWPVLPARAGQPLPLDGRVLNHSGSWLRCARTRINRSRFRKRDRGQPAMKEIYTWMSIFSVVAFSTAGDVLISNAMKRVGDVGPLYRKIGLAGVVKSISGKWHSMDGSYVHGRQLLQPAAGALVG